jgi:hypothetical protein
VSEGSTALRVSQSGDGSHQLVLSNIKAPKNGYAYIYLSNENDDPVYFPARLAYDKYICGQAGITLRLAIQEEE